VAHRSDRKRRQACRPVAVLLLGRPGPAVGRGSIGIARNTRCSGRTASFSELDGERENGAKVVWDVGGVGVSL
jgi:hypothetical protein